MIKFVRLIEKIKSFIADTFLRRGIPSLSFILQKSDPSEMVGTGQGEERREETFQSKFRNRNSKLIDGCSDAGPRHTGITLDSSGQWDICRRTGIYNRKLTTSPNPWLGRAWLTWAGRRLQLQATSCSHTLICGEVK